MDENNEIIEIKGSNLKKIIVIIFHLMGIFIFYGLTQISNLWFIPVISILIILGGVLGIKDILFFNNLIITNEYIERQL